MSYLYRLMLSCNAYVKKERRSQRQPLLNKKQNTSRILRVSRLHMPDFIIVNILGRVASEIFVAKTMKVKSILTKLKLIIHKALGKIASAIVDYGQQGKKLANELSRHID